MFESPDPAAPEPVRGLIVGNNRLRLWGMSATERLRRNLRQSGVHDIAAQDDQTGNATPFPDGRVIIASNDWVFDATLIRDLAARHDDVVLLDPAGEIPVAANLPWSQLEETFAEIPKASHAFAPGIAQLTPAQLSGAYNHALRKREAPYLLRLTRANLPAIEARMFGASYKGVTDAVTKYLWPRPALMVTRICADLGVTPNQVTLLGFALTLWSFWLFWNGHFALGLASAWLMTFLDTVDGKLARVTLSSSKIGNVFDHGIDLIHPPFWWWAWIVGLPAYGAPLPHADAVLAVIVIGYVMQRLIEGLFESLFGMHVHVWRRFDSRFRLWTARRNPNLLILTPALMLGRPDAGIALVAAWTLISLIVHASQIVQALIARRHGPLESWLVH